jgi:hypothetical protein
VDETDQQSVRCKVESGVLLVGRQITERDEQLAVAGS